MNKTLILSYFQNSMISVQSLCRSPMSATTSRWNRVRMMIDMGVFELWQLVSWLQRLSYLIPWPCLWTHRWHLDHILESTIIRAIKCRCCLYNRSTSGNVRPTLAALRDRWMDPSSSFPNRFDSWQMTVQEESCEEHLLVSTVGPRDRRNCRCLVTYQPGW